MTTLEVLLNAVESNPQDTAARAAYSDRLAETNNHPEAIRQKILLLQWEWLRSLPPLKLCYVEDLGHQTYQVFFTTLPIEDQWGDDWNDSPYEHNAERPNTPFRCSDRVLGNISCRCRVCHKDHNLDGTPKWRIFSIITEAFPYETPSAKSYQLHPSNYSVQDINSGKAPWFRRDNHTYPICDNELEEIPAGTDLLQFCTEVERHEANWVPLPEYH